MALSPLERKRRQLSTPQGRALHAATQRRYYRSGGRHQECATKAQRRIDRMVTEHPELEALNGQG